MSNALASAFASLWAKINALPPTPAKPVSADVPKNVTVSPQPSVPQPQPVANPLSGKPLDYLIGTDGPQQGHPNRITEPSLGTVPAANGLSIAYINLRREDGEPAKYGPYLPHDDIWKQYAEGRPDPKGEGYKRNIVEQLDRAVAQGHHYAEQDNPDSYPLDAVMQAIAWAEERRFQVVAKNPFLLNDGAVQYLAHPAVIGAIVEDQAGTPDEMDELRRKAGKPDLPVWFVSFGNDQRARVTLTAKGAARYHNMGVTYSSAGEYGNSVDILLPDSGSVAEPPAQPSVSVSSPSNEAEKTDMPPTPASVAQKPTQIISAIIPGNTAHFEACVKLVLVHEGGNDDDPRDPGGRTSRGIIQSEWNVWRQSHPGLPSDVWQAPQDQVLAIYKAKYWDALSCDQLPYGVDYCLFDYGVNSGISRSAKLLQQLVGVPADGQIGPATVKATATADTTTLVNKLCDARLAFLKGLGTWGTFGRGWATRVADVRRDALAMVHTSTAPAPSLEPKPPSPPTHTVSLLDPDRIVGWMTAHGCTVETSPKHVNIVYLEGVSADGSRNDNRRDLWNDRRLVLQYDASGKPQIILNCDATTTPGIYYDVSHVIAGPQGAALIAPGQQQCWQVGYIHAGKPSSHECLVQDGAEVVVYRDFDKSFRRQEGHTTKGFYGIDHHGTYPLAEGDPKSVQAFSAGCLVARRMVDHREFMRLVKSDERYLSNHQFVFAATVIPVEWQT